MTQPAQQSAPQQSAPAPASDVVHVPSMEERSAAAFGDSPPSDPAAESSTGDSSQPSPPLADSTAGSAGDAAAERRARIEALKQQERERVDAQQRRHEHESIRKRMEDAERRAAEAERIAAQRPDIESEDEFFAIAERAKVTPQRLGEWLRERMSNPERAAAQAAAKSIDPKISALEQKLAAQDQIIRQFLTQQQTEREEHAERQAVAEFNSFTEQSAATAPHAAAFLRNAGHEEFAKLARSAAASVPEGAGYQAVLDEIEDNLSRLAAMYVPSGTQQRTQAFPKPNPAAAKATTVTNSLAQGRASIVDEDKDWASLPFEERSARLFR